MAISTAREAGDVTVVTVEGQLIVANRQELKQVIQDALDGGARKFVVDFGPTAYIDSSGLGALVSINRKVREQGGELRLAGLNEDLRSLFELTKLDTLFLIVDSATQALERF
jgi:anti-sigma B factor antagonist